MAKRVGFRLRSTYRCQFKSMNPFIVAILWMNFLNRVLRTEDVSSVGATRGMPKGIHTVDFPVATFHLKWTKSLKLNNPGGRIRVI